MSSDGFDLSELPEFAFPEAEPDEEEPKGPEAAELRKQARFWLDMDRSTDALKPLQQLVDLYPDDYEGWCQIAHVFHALEDKERALRAAGHAIEADPYSADGYAWKARIQIHHGDWKEALETLQTGAQMTYGDAELERWTVRALIAGDKHWEARQQSTLAANDAEAASLRGEIALKGDEVAAADAEYRHAITLNPGNAEAWVGTASVLLKQDRPLEAVACIQRAVQLDPARPEWNRRIVEVLDAAFARGYPRTSVPGEIADRYSVSKARQVRSEKSGTGCILWGLAAVVALIATLAGLGWEAALRLLLLVVIAFVISLALEGKGATPAAEVRFRFPGDPWVPEEAPGEQGRTRPQTGPWEPSHVAAGWRFLEEGKAAIAQEKARAALSGDPEEVPALLLFSTAALFLPDREPGLAAAKSARNLDPNDTEAHALVWAHLAVSGRLDEAVANARQEEAVAEEIGGYFVWLVRMEFEYGTAEHARALSQFIQRVYPGTAEPHVVEAEWAYERRRWAEAEAAYRRALSLDPEAASVQSSLGWALQQRWRFREAYEQARRALALDPTDANAQALLVRLTQGLTMGLPVLLSLGITLAACIPTLLGRAHNPWMLPATLLNPMFSACAAYLLAKPVLRSLAPGMLVDLHSSSSLDPWGSFLVAGGITLTIQLTVHSLQAWAEILLHHGLLHARWQGAVTVTACAALACVTATRLILEIRREN